MPLKAFRFNGVRFREYDVIGRLNRYEVNMGGLTVQADLSMCSVAKDHTHRCRRLVRGQLREFRIKGCSVGRVIPYGPIIRVVSLKTALSNNCVIEMETSKD